MVIVNSKLSDHALLGSVNALLGLVNAYVWADECVNWTDDCADWAAECVAWAADCAGAYGSVCYGCKNSVARIYWSWNVSPSTVVTSSYAGPG